MLFLPKQLVNVYQDKFLTLYSCYFKSVKDKSVIWLTMRSVYIFGALALLYSPMYNVI